MSSSPNPFADDPLPEGVVRLRSAVDPLDPYAAAPSAEEYHPPVDPGVGLWRDGNYLVMHLDADFPARCLATNEPTSIRRKQSLSWCYPIDWNTRTLPLEYFISPAEQQRMKRTRRIGLIVAGVVAVVMIVAWQIPAAAVGLHLGRLRAILFGCLMVAFFSSLGKVWKPGLSLQFVRARKSYLWLSGPKPAFLNSLPTWPGLK